MILSFSFQLKIFITAILAGMFMGFFYDNIKFLRKVFLHKNIFIQIEDIIYWISMAILTFLTALYQNNGEIRLFFISGIIIGMIVYFLLFSKFLNKIYDKILYFIKIFLKKYILAPLKSLLIPFKKLIKKLKIKIKAILKKLLQNIKKYEKIHNNDCTEENNER